MWEVKAMCESHAYLIEGDEERLIMEDVINIKEEGGKVTLSNIIGEESVLEAELASISLLDHRVRLRPL
jgi:predicted RNA-binding protein